MFSRILTTVSDCIVAGAACDSVVRLSPQLPVCGLVPSSPEINGVKLINAGPQMPRGIDIENASIDSAIFSGSLAAVAGGTIAEYRNHDFYSHSTNHHV